MADVFISYARSDRDRVALLAAALEGAGYSVWWDHDIAGGAAFAAEIERALNGAKSVVVAWSVNAVQSEWVIDEAGVAKKQGKLVPIRLDATPAPIGFRQYQEVDFSGWNGAGDADPISALKVSLERYMRRGAPTMKADLVEERAHSGYAETLAVLPLENLTGDDSQQFLVDGVHEALITDLSKIGSLKVISRTSSKLYVGSDKSAREIGAELGVAKIVEGSVMRADDEVRVTVQLIDARTDTHLWAESFDRNMTNVLKLQRDVASAIVEEIAVILTPDEQSRLSAAPAVRSEAYEAYLKGMYHWYKLTPEDMQAALKWFDASLAADPEYAPAHAGVGMIWAGIQQMGVMPPRVVAPKIKAAVDQALALDPGLFQAHFTHAVHLTWSEWDWAAADQAYQRAIELNPNFPDTHAYYSHYLNIVGRFENAAAEINKALNLDPFNPLIRALYGVNLTFWEHYDEAVEQFQTVIKAAPGHWLPYQILRAAYALQGKEDDALEATRTLYTILEKPTVVEALDAGKAAGGYQAALKAGAEALAKLAETSYIMPTQIAYLYGSAGEADAAVVWFEKGFEARDPEMPYLKYLRRFTKALAGEPRMQAIIDEMNYPDLAAKISH